MNEKPDLAYAEFLAEAAAKGLKIIRDLTPGIWARPAKLRSASRKKYAESEAGKIANKNAKAAWRKSDVGRASKAAWQKSDAGRASKAAWQKSDAGRTAKDAWRKSEAGQTCKKRELAARSVASLEKYLNRPFVAIDSEGRAPLHTIDSEGRAPLDAWKQTGKPSRYLTKDSSGYYWEDHEISLIGAAAICRPFGTPIENAVWQTPSWIENPKSTEDCFDYLLSLPEQYFEKGKPAPLFIMFSASYDWSMWCKDIYFDKAFELARRRGFAPPCKRMQGYVFRKKYAIQIRPYMHFMLGELRWPDDPYGELHKDDPLYKKGVKLQFIKKITIIDTFRFSPMSFVETIRPLMKRGLIPKEVFDTIERDKMKRGGFHSEPMETVKRYTSYELHSLCVFMHMMRDAYWTAGELRLHSFHSPASASSALFKMINVRDHSWPVKSVTLDYEQMIAHWAYFGGRFECMLKGYYQKPAYQYDLASAYPYAMQVLPSMTGGYWEKCETATPKEIAQSCILSIFRVEFDFYIDAPFYPFPFRLPGGVILYPRAGNGFYMRDDVLAAIAWCKRFKVPVTKALIIEEANFFHPVSDAPYPFTPIADAYIKRIEFDKKDPKGPEQLALKLMINACYGKLAERIFRGIDPKTGNPKIPPHACPWYASAITAHTRRELMIAALQAPKLIMQFATDAVYSQIPLALPRLKSEADIKAGQEDKLLGDWCGSKVPGAVFIQSGLAFYCDENKKVLEVKSRGLPLKNLKKAQTFLDEAFEAWLAPYDPDGVQSLKAEKIARHVSVRIKAFMPLSLAIMSPEKYKKLHCKWGLITKTVWLDDTGGKRDMEDDRDLNFLASEAVPTVPKENPLSEGGFPSILYLPPWVENMIEEEKRQTAAINQFHNIVGTDVGANEQSYDGFFDEDDAEFAATSETDMLLKTNMDIEI